MKREQIENVIRRFNSFLYCGEQMNRWNNIKEEYTAAIEWLKNNIPAGELKTKSIDGSMFLTIKGSSYPLITVYNDGKENFDFIIG